MGQAPQSQIRCCAQEVADRRIEDLNVHDGDDAGDYVSQGDSPNQWGECCHVREVPTSHFPDGEFMLESLSHVPTRFDEGTTTDNDRSHARYAKLVLHSTRARTQRRSKAWEEWLRAATVGRPITLLTGFRSPRAAGEETEPTCTKVAATYFLDRGLTKVSIYPAGSSNQADAIAFMVDNIQVICPASDFMLFFDQVDTKLEESEKARAVLLQYVTEDTERRRICFLEESEEAKERFVQALTALWLEKRNEYSMWF